jgi:hypothetical protein
LIGEYFNNPTWIGTPTLTRLDRQINFIWFLTAPGPGMPSDNYSVRWSGQIRPNFAGEQITFRMLADQRARLLLNGNEIIPFTSTGTGSYTFTDCTPVPAIVEFTEDNISAGVQLFWSSPQTNNQLVPSHRLLPSQSLAPTATPTVTTTPTATSVTAVNCHADGSGLLGEYFNNSAWSGLPVLSRIDPEINFTWFLDAPDPAVNADGFTARWSGTVRPRVANEQITFRIVADTRARLRINQSEMIPLASAGSGTFSFTGCTPVAIEVEYFEDIVSAGITLFWSSSSTSEQIVPQEYLFPATATSYEPFGSATGDLQGASSGVGFTAAWNTLQANDLTVVANGLNDPSGQLRVSGNRAISNATVQSLAASRNLILPLGAPGTTAWFSILIRPESSSGRYGGLTLGGRTRDGVGGLFIGAGVNGTWGMNNSGTGTGQVNTSTLASQASTSLLVIRIDFASGPDSATLYVNPQPGLAAPNAPAAAVVVKSDVDLSMFSQIVLHSGENTAFSFDELRIGPTYASVTPSQ